MYSQNGDSVYQSDSEESISATNVSNADNRANTPAHSNSSLSPLPTKQITLQNSPSHTTRTDSFSPRYSPPVLNNHLDTNTVATASDMTTPQNHLHADSFNSGLTSQTADMVPHAALKTENIINMPATSHGLNMPITSQHAHINNPLSSHSALANMAHQLYKSSPQPSPTSGLGGYNMATNPYSMASQYPHSLPLINQSQSRF